MRKLLTFLALLLAWPALADSTIEGPITFHGFDVHGAVVSPLSFESFVLTPSSVSHAGIASPIAPYFIDGRTITTNSHTASIVGHSGEKINSLGAYHHFGGAAGGAGNAGEGSRTAIFATLEQDGPSNYTSALYNFYTGIFGYVYVPAGNTTVGQEPSYTGVAGLTEVGGAGTRVFNMEGAEFDVACGTGTVCGNRIGIAIASGAGVIPSTVQGTSFDGAYTIASDGGANWRLGYTLGSPNGVWPFDSNATLIGTWGTGTAGTGIDLTGVTTFAFNQWVSGNPSTGVGGWIADSTGHYKQNNAFPDITLKDSAVAVTAGGLTRWTSHGDGNWCEEINTAAGGNFSATILGFCMGPTGILATTNFTITPSSPASGAACATGQITTDAGFIYVCTASGVWKRVAIVGGY